MTTLTVKVIFGSGSQGTGTGGTTNLSYSNGVVSNSNGSGFTIPDASSGNKGLFSAANFVKLSNIAENATANSSDSQLLSRSNHTGQQSTSTILGLDAALSAYASHQSSTSNPHNVTKAQIGLGNVDNTADTDKPISSAVATALSGKANTNDARFSDAREWSANTVTEPEAVAGTGTVRVAWTVLRVWQAIRAFLGGVSVTNTPEVGQVLKATSTTTAAWGPDHTGGGGSGTTDLSAVVDADDLVVSNTNGTGFTIPLATSTTSGLFSPSNFNKLGTVATGATANSLDSFLLSRLNHTGTQPASTISGLSTVATSGSYADLSGRPTFGSAAFVEATAFATTAQGTKADNAVPIGSFLAISADTTIISSHNNVVFDTGTTSRAFTIDNTLPGTFVGFAVEGPCTFVQGSGVTITEDRPTGKGYNYCQVVRTGTARYRVFGGRT